MRRAGHRGQRDRQVGGAVDSCASRRSRASRRACGPGGAARRLSLRRGADGRPTAPRMARCASRASRPLHQCSSTGDLSDSMRSILKATVVLGFGSAISALFGLLTAKAAAVHLGPVAVVVVLLLLLRGPTSRPMLGGSGRASDVVIVAAVVTFSIIYVLQMAILNAHHRVMALATAAVPTSALGATMQILLFRQFGIESVPYAVAATAVVQ